MRIMLFCLLLAGCAGAATAENYQNSLQNWVGVSEETLVAEWGEPSSQYQASENQKIITYNQVFAGPIGGNLEPYSGSEVYYPATQAPLLNLPPDGNENEQYYCQTSFTVENGEIVDFTFSGDDCVSN